MGDPTSRPVTGYPLHPPNGHPPTTAYSYQAPPPNSSFYNQNPYVYPTQRRPTFLRRLFASIIILCFLFFLILFILWLVFRPHYPEYRVTSLSLTNFNLSVSSQKVSGNWVVHFEAYNPNKKLKLSYDQIDPAIFYKSWPLSETRIPPFDQDTRNLTALEAMFSALDVSIEYANSMSNDIVRTGSIGFDFKLAANVACKTGAFRVRRRIVRAICSDIKVVGVNGNGGSGNFTGGPMRCSVY